MSRRPAECLRASWSSALAPRPAIVSAPSTDLAALPAPVAAIRDKILAALDKNDVEALLMLGRGEAAIAPPSAATSHARQLDRADFRLLLEKVAAMAGVDPTEAAEKYRILQIPGDHTRLDDGHAILRVDA